MQEESVPGRLFFLKSLVSFTIHAPINSFTSAPPRGTRRGHSPSVSSASEMLTPPAAAAPPPLWPVMAATMDLLKHPVHMSKSHPPLQWCEVPPRLPHTSQ